MSRIVRVRQNFVNNTELTENKWYDVTSNTDEDFTITLDNGRIYTANIKNSLILDNNDWEVLYEAEKVLTHVIVPEGACSYLTAGEIIEVKVDNPRSDGSTYFESFNRNTRIMGILNGDGHTNYIPWIPIYNNQLPSPPDVIHTDNNTPTHRWAFISNLTETKSNIKAGKHYDIIEEIDNKVLIEDETGSKIWMGKNYSEYLHGGKPELIK